MRRELRQDPSMFIRLSSVFSLTEFLAAVRESTLACVVGRWWAAVTHSHLGFENRGTHVTQCQEARKHKRLMKKASQLEWKDLERIAEMKGLGTFVRAEASGVEVPKPENAADAVAMVPANVGLTPDNLGAEEASPTASPDEAKPSEAASSSSSSAAASAAE